jgi:hypothetical protein
VKGEGGGVDPHTLSLPASLAPHLFLDDIH